MTIIAPPPRNATKIRIRRATLGSGGPPASLHPTSAHDVGLMDPGFRFLPTPPFPLPLDLEALLPKGEQPGTEKHRRPHSRGVYADIRDRVDNCGRVYKVHTHVEKQGGCGARVGTPMRCERLWCAPCYEKWAEIQREKILKEIMTYQWPSMIALTVPSVPLGELESQHKRINACFKELRRWPVWKANVRAGVVTLGLTYNPDAGHHDHRHGIIDSRWLDVLDFKAKWTSIVKRHFPESVYGKYEFADQNLVRVTPGREAAAVEEIIAGTEHDLKALLAQFDENEILAVEVIEALAGKPRVMWFGERKVTKVEDEIQSICCPKCGARYCGREWERQDVSREVFEYRARDGILWKDYYSGWGRHEKQGR